MVAVGHGLYVAENPSGGTLQGTEYAANYRIENGTVTMIHTDAGYYTPYPAPSGGTGASYRHIWYLKDHLGNNRVLADGSGNAVAIHDYDPFGEEIATASSSLPYPFPPGGTESPYKYGGKEWNVTTSTYDFEARYLSPSFHRFTTMDPLAEKYYSISPYAYCADNPINLVDPDGMQWYLCTDEEGRTTYEYYEGEMPDEEKEKYKSVSGSYYYFYDTDNNKYYSLFGRVLHWTNPSEKNTSDIYNMIDRLIYSFFMGDNPESIFPKKTDTYIPGLRDHGIFAVSYNGRTFSTVPFDENHKYDITYNSLFWNNDGQSASIYPSQMPIGITSNQSYPNRTEAYWLIANNASKAVRGGIRVLQLKFDDVQSQAFLRSCVTLFSESENAQIMKKYIR